MADFSLFPSVFLLFCRGNLQKKKISLRGGRYCPCCHLKTPLFHSAGNKGHHNSLPSERREPERGHKAGFNGPSSLQCQVTSSASPPDPENKSAERKHSGVVHWVVHGANSTNYNTNNNNNNNGCDSQHSSSLEQQSFPPPQAWLGFSKYKNIIKTSQAWLGSIYNKESIGFTGG